MAFMTKAFNGIKSTMTTAGAFGIGAYNRAMPGIKGAMSASAAPLGFGVQAGHQALRSGMSAFRSASGYAGGMGFGKSAMAGLRAGGNSLSTSFMGATRRGKAGMMGVGGIGAGGAGMAAWGLSD